jgi:hypothetical protein
VMPGASSHRSSTARTRHRSRNAFGEHRRIAAASEMVRKIGSSPSGAAGAVLRARVTPYRHACP